MFVDPYEACVAHGGVAELFWGLLLRPNESALRWCPEGAHMSEIAHLHWRFVLVLIQRLH